MEELDENNPPPDFPWGIEQWRLFVYLFNDIKAEIQDDPERSGE